MTKLDLLVLGAHPDDAELGAGGIIASHIGKGKTVGVIDFTKGELGSRGTPQIRKEEADAASKILGLTVRENLGLADGFFENNQASQLTLIQAIRKYRPEVVLANAPIDRHIDHGRGAALAKDACFLSGLAKIHTKDSNGNAQKHWRPKALYHYVQDYHLTPLLVIDVTDFWQIKMRAVKAYSTQFYTPNQEGPQTPISSPDFLHFLEARGREMGRMIGVEFGEGLIKATPIGTDNLFKLY